MQSVVEIYNRVVIFQSPPRQNISKNTEKSVTRKRPLANVQNFYGRTRTRNPPRCASISPPRGATCVKDEISVTSPDKSVQVKLELGHKATLRKKLTTEGFTHDWTIFVRGPEGSNIQHFVEKVVFHLHESFPKPKRVIKEPPYSVTESGYGSFNLPVEIYFKAKEEPRKIKFDYDLFLHLTGSPPVNHLRCEKLTFQNPTEDFRRKLIKAGGVGILGSNEASPTTTQSSTMPTTPQTESKAFAELFGSSVQSESSGTKTSIGQEVEHHHSKKKKSSHSKDRDKDREKSKSKSSSAHSPAPPSTNQSTPKSALSPPGSAEKSSKDKHSSKRDSSEHTSKKKRKDKEKDREKSKDRHRDKGRDKEKDKERDKEGKEHSKEKHGEEKGSESKRSEEKRIEEKRTEEKHIEEKEKEKRRDKGEKTTASIAKINSGSPDKGDGDMKNKERIKERDREKTKHKESSSAATSSSSKKKSHKRSHKGSERDSSKDPGKADKEGHDSPTKQLKTSSPQAPQRKTQLPPMSDLFSTSDYDPFEDEEQDLVEPIHTPPKAAAHKPSGHRGSDHKASEGKRSAERKPPETDRGQRFIQSLQAESDSEDDMDMSEDEEVDVESTEMAPLFPESEPNSPIAELEPHVSPLHMSPPQIEPAISNGFSPHMVIPAEPSPGRSQSSDKKHQRSHSTKSPSVSSSRRSNDKSPATGNQSMVWPQETDTYSSKHKSPSPRDVDTPASMPTVSMPAAMPAASMPVISMPAPIKRLEPELSRRDTDRDEFMRREPELTREPTLSWGSPQATVLAKSNRLSPPRLGMDPPDLLKSTQHGDLLQYQASQQRLPRLEKENHLDNMIKPAGVTDLPEPHIEPGYAPNGEKFELLIELQEKLNTTKDGSTLSDVVHILEECGEVFAITDASLDFDLCYLKSATVHRLKHCLLPETCS